MNNNSEFIIAQTFRLQVNWIVLKKKSSQALGRAGDTIVFILNGSIMDQKM
jgi:hypothetical protein